MTNYTYEEKQIAIKILKDLMAHEVECTRKLFGAFSSHLHAVPSNLIREKIKQLKTVTFGDIKNQVGVKFKMRGKFIYKIVKDYGSDHLLILDVKDSVIYPIEYLKDADKVEVINETETTSKSGG